MPGVEVVVGLDIGTTCIRTLIADVDEEGAPHAIGLGEAPSQGLRRGVIVNLEQTVNAILLSVENAERMADVEVTSVYVGVASEHIRGINSHATVSVGREGDEITQEDVERAIAHATAIPIPPDLEIIHVITQDFIVDGEETVKNPVGLTGSRLESEVHIITGGVNILRNIRRAVERAGLETAGIVLEPLASSLAVLTPDEQELGVAILDIGGGTSDVAVFNQENIRHTSVIGLGGMNVTRDVAHVLGTPMKEAERLKIEYGSASVGTVNPNESVDVPRLGDAPPQNVPTTHLAEIIQARTQELFTMALRKITRTDWGHLLASGIVLTGGGALSTGVVELAQQVFDMPVKVGGPKGVGTVTETIDSPIYSTAVGLVIYGAMQQGTSGPTASAGHGRQSSGGDRFKQWIRSLW